MSVLLSNESRILIVGATGRFGRLTLEDMRAAGSNVVAGVSYKAKDHLDIDIPLFTSVEKAVTETGANAAIVFIPAKHALDSLLETFESGINLVVYPGEGLPVSDSIKARHISKKHEVTYIGANTPGIIVPGIAKLGFMPTACYQPGRIGLISRSGSLSYEAAALLTRHGLGQSTAIGIGGDPIRGLTAAEALQFFHEDTDTDVVVYLGEIGGDAEYEVADYAARPGSKPIVTHIVGRTAPIGKQMGHAAALVGSYRDTWEAKVKALETSGAKVVRSIADLPQDASQALKEARSFEKIKEG